MRRTYAPGTVFIDGWYLTDRELGLYFLGQLERESAFRVRSQEPRPPLPAYTEPEPEPTPKKPAYRPVQGVQRVIDGGVNL